MTEVPLRQREVQQWPKTHKSNVVLVKKKQKKQHNQNKRERGQKKSVGPQGVWAEPGVPVDRQANGEICHFIVLVSTNTIWRGL